MLQLQPIPTAKFPQNNVCTAFTEDKLVSVLSYFNGKILVEPVYERQGLAGAAPECKIRSTVAKRLEMALSALPKGFTFKIYDGFRTVQTQQMLYNRYYAQLWQQHPDLSPAELENKTKQFVSLPSLDASNPSVHNTGGAIDLTIFDLKENKELNMGTEFDDFTSKAHTRFFEENCTTLAARQIQQNRRLLYWCMRSAGFTNLPTEWWHYDYGDWFWAFYTGKPALFKGIINERK